MQQITLRASRVNRGLTQLELAEKLNVSQYTVMNWEKGKSCPTIRQARKLCEILEMPIENIFFD